MKSKKRGDREMNIPKGYMPNERAAYKAGYEYGEKEGLQKAIMFLQLLAGDTKSFKEEILQTSPEAVELRKILAE